MSYQFTAMTPTIRIRLFDTVTSQDFAQCIAEVYKIEAECIDIPDRILDIRDVSDFELHFSTMFPFTEARKKMVLPKDIKTAIIVNQPLQIGLARMYQSLNTNPRVSIQIFSTLADAESWVNDPG